MSQAAMMCLPVGPPGLRCNVVAGTQVMVEEGCSV